MLCCATQPYPALTEVMRGPKAFDTICRQLAIYADFSAFIGRTPRIMQETSDWQLIRAYLDEGNETAFEVLLKRHYDMVYKRLVSHIKHPDDAADLTQQIWIRVINNLPNYKDDGKFPSFLMKATSNMLTDYWRRKGVKGQVIQETLETEESVDPIVMASDQRTETSNTIEAREQVDYLVRELIPALDCEQRLAFLLMHESEHWEEDKRLGWNHMAELNGIDEQTAWERFETVRNALMQNINGKTDVRTDCEEMLVFLVWTQAQRLRKNSDFTWDYFSNILGTPTNTLKTRYRTALKKLSTGLKNASGEAS